MVQGYLSFDHFSTNTWQYVSNYSDLAWNIMNESEKQEFNIDVTSIDWAKAEQNFMYGIRRFFLREDIMPPESKFQQLLVKSRSNVEYFHDVRVALRAATNVNRRSNTMYFDDVLSHEKFNAFLQAKFQGQQRRVLKPKNQSKREAAYVGKESGALSFDVEQAKVQLNEMRSEISPHGMRALIYIFNKNMRSAIKGLHVDMTGL